MLCSIAEQSAAAMHALLDVAKCRPGDIVVVGCSSSEIIGSKIGTASSPDVAAAVVDAILPIVKERGLYLAAQCCEHLNRALIVEQEAVRVHGLEQVNVVPQPKAGGSFATAVYARMQQPVAVEFVQASAGLDIGGTLIGMHLKRVAVPVRLPVDHIGEAILLAARVRPKFVGGVRAVYDDNLL